MSYHWTQPEQKDASTIEKACILSRAFYDGLLQHPDMCHCVRTSEITLEISCHPEDKKIIFGPRGKILQSLQSTLRTLLNEEKLELHIHHDGEAKTHSHSFV